MLGSVVASGSIFIIFWSGRSCFGAVFDGASGAVLPVRGLGAAAGAVGAEVAGSEAGATAEGALVGNGWGEFGTRLAADHPLCSLATSAVALEDARELDTIVVVVDPSLLAVPLTLPFSGKKQISALINAEFSDLVPFDADLYHKEFRYVVGREGSKRSDGKLSEISLMAMPKELYDGLNSWLDAGEIRPKVVAPACSLLSEVLSLNPNYKDGVTLVIGQIDFRVAGCVVNDGAALPALEEIHLVLGLLDDGQLVAERIVPPGARESALATWITQFLIQASHLTQTGIDDLKMLLITPSEALNRQITPQLLQRVKTAFKGAISGGDDAVMRDGASGGSISELKISQNDASDDGVTAVRTWAQLAALQMARSVKTRIAPNFRRPQILKHPRMGDINKGLLKVSPYVGGLFLVLLVTAFIAFTIRERQLDLLKFTLRLRIQEFVPNFESPEGEEVNTLRRQNKILDDQLKDLGTTSALNPLQAFSIISRELPAGSNITIRSINLRSNTILISGAAPDYSAVEKVERMLKRRKDIFCRIKKDTPGSAGQADKRAFSFDIALCDSGV